MEQETRLQDVVFVDIETVPAYPRYEDLPETEKKLWERKCSYGAKDPVLEYERAGIYAEFGRVLCISTGVILEFAKGRMHLKIETFADEDEYSVLTAFVKFLRRRNRRPTKLCAHNGKEFDFPYLARRMLIHGIQLPPLLNTAGLKPWQTPNIDTMDMWKFGDYKHYTSLELLAHVFGIGSPKQEMSGKDVANTWYIENNLRKIRNYCEADLHTLATLYCHLTGISQPKLEIMLVR